MSKLKFISTILFAFLIASCVTQRSASNSQSDKSATVSLKDRYANYIPSDEKIITGTYTTVNSVADSIGCTYLVRTFNPDKLLCTEMTTHNCELYDAKDGPYKEWWDNGFIKTEGQYLAGKKNGTWKGYSFDEEKEVLYELNYKPGKLHGISKRYKNKTLVSSYTYDSGLKQGPFEEYNESGDLVKEGTYKVNQIIENTIHIEPDSTRSGSIIKPTFPGCEEIEDAKKKSACSQKKMLTFIYSNIRYPADARINGVQGTAIFRFDIDKDGSIINVVCKHGLSKSLEEESMRVIRLMPKWNPRLENNQPIKAQIDLPINYKLQ